MRRCKGILPPNGFLSPTRFAIHCCHWLVDYSDNTGLFGKWSRKQKVLYLCSNGLLNRYDVYQSSCDSFAKLLVYLTVLLSFIHSLPLVFRSFQIATLLIVFKYLTVDFMSFHCQFASYMESTVFSDVTRLMLTTPHNASTTTPPRSNGDGDDDGFVLWLPLIFIILFSVVVIGLIIASRFSFSCCRCDDDRRSRQGMLSIVRFICLCWILQVICLGAFCIYCDRQ